MVMKRSLKKTMMFSGFSTKRVADMNTTSADLCVNAAEVLFEEMNYDKNKVDAIVYVTETPDYIMPATSCVIHNRLGLKRECAVFDVNQGCAGYTYGLWIAGMMLNANCSSVLLLVGDTLSKISDFFSDKSLPLFGDGGSATLLEHSEDSKPIYFDIGTDSSNYDVIMAKNGGFRNIPHKDDYYEDGKYKYLANMDGKKVFDFVLREISPSITNILDYANINKNEVDYFVLHQANKFILENVARQLGIEMEKMPVQTITDYGNQSCTSIPSAICHTLFEEVSTQKLNLLLCGFGIGLSWVSTIVTIDSIYCSGVREL